MRLNSATMRAFDNDSVCIVKFGESAGSAISARAKNIAPFSGRQSDSGNRETQFQTPNNAKRVFQEISSRSGYPKKSIQTEISRKNQQAWALCDCLNFRSPSKLLSSLQATFALVFINQFRNTIPNEKFQNVNSKLISSKASRISRALLSLLRSRARWLTCCKKVF